MSTAMATEVSPLSLLANSGFVSQPWVARTARLASRRLKSSVVVITAYGDIDASNAGAVTEYTLGHLTGCRALILDLRGVAGDQVPPGAASATQTMNEQHYRPGSRLRVGDSATGEGHPAFHHRYRRRARGTPTP
jgi:hypothetical protein